MSSPSALMEPQSATTGSSSRGLRVLTLTNMYPTPEEPGFAPFVPEQVAAILADERVETCDVQIIDGRASTMNYARGLRTFRHKIATTPYDVIHAHYGLTGAIAVAQRRVPAVVTFHGGDVDGPLRSTQWQRQISRVVARRTAANICVSRKMQPVLKASSTYLPCGIDLRMFTPRDRDAARDAFAVPASSLAVLFPSSPKRDYKNHPGFLEVVAELRSRGRDVHELVLDGIPRERVPEFMAAADVMLMTSTQEGTPVAVMEAMACGLPVVSTNIGDVSSMLEDAIPGNAYVGPFDPRRLADAVESVYRPEVVDRQPLRGRDRFDGTMIGTALVDILEQAARGVR